MPPMKSVTVAKRFDGTWTVKPAGATKAASLHKTMDEAVEAGKRLLRRTGGELHLKVNYEIKVEIVPAGS